jgi:hypothetical protein
VSFIPILPNTTTAVTLSRGQTSQSPTHAAIINNYKKSTIAGGNGTSSLSLSDPPLSTVSTQMSSEVMGAIGPSLNMKTLVKLGSKDNNSLGSPMMGATHGSFP